MADFTIRVYGLIIEENKILLSRECIAGKWVVKFPGGGLEFGEGTRDCLQREIKEETGLDAQIGDHFYTTDFFQPSHFHRKPTQVLSIYYFARLLRIESLAISKNAEESGFFWLKFNDLYPEVVDLPIDRKVVEKLIENR